MMNKFISIDMLNIYSIAVVEDKKKQKEIIADNEKRG